MAVCKTFFATRKDNFQRRGRIKDSVNEKPHPGNNSIIHQTRNKRHFHPYIGASTVFDQLLEDVVKFEWRYDCQATPHVRVYDKYQKCPHGWIRLFFHAIWTVGQ